MIIARFIGLLLLFSTMLPGLSEAGELYAFENNKQNAQFYGLLHDLRCLVCQNQDLVDSNAPLAKDLRQSIYRFVQQGKTDAEIIGFLTERYGDYILFNPPFKALTSLLWVGPLIFLLLGVFIYRRTWRDG